MDNNEDLGEFTIGQHSDSEPEPDTDCDSETDDDIEELMQSADTWDRAFNPNLNTFVNPELKFKPDVNVMESTTPFELLKMYLTSDMIDKICVESSRYVKQVKRVTPTSFSKWSDVSSTELWRFLALNMAMGINWRPSLKDYWSTNEILYSPIFPKTMSRNRFEDILRSLHFVDNSTVPNTNQDRYVKLGTFMEDLLKNLKSIVNPGEFLCLDESLVPFKGRVSFRQYNPKKRGRFGLKFFVLVDCDSHLTLDLIPYQGKPTRIDKTYVKEMGFGGAAVLTMLHPFINKNHKVILDNYFNSPTLGTEMIKKGTHILGTVQKRRKLMPKMSTRLKKGEIETYSNGKLLVERWRDRREVVMLNSFVPHEMKPAHTRHPTNTRNKPNSVLIYNKKMGAVDEMDKCIRPYSHDRRTYKWYKKAFFYLMEVAIYNAYKIYGMFHAKKSYKDFLMLLIHEILEKNTLIRSARGRPSTQPKPKVCNDFHMPTKMKTAKGKTSLSDCYMCKQQGIRRQTSFKCKTCNKRLCITDGVNCFQLYHTKAASQCNVPVNNENIVAHEHSAVDNPHEAEDAFDAEPTDFNVSILAPPSPFSTLLSPARTPTQCDNSLSILSNAYCSFSQPASPIESSNSISLLHEDYIY